MAGMQGIVPFGTLTSKKIKVETFEEIDLNKDGILTEEEFETALGKEAFDTLDLSTIDKDADKKVTKEEYERWTQEADIANFMNTFKKQVFKDFIGQSNDDIMALLKALDNFKNEYIKNYSEFDDINKMSANFKKTIQTKYSEFKKNTLENNSDAIKERVIESIIEEVINDTKQGGRKFLGIINNSSGTLSENAKRLLGNVLGKEADKFIKNNNSENMEEDLAEYLRTFLETTDKSKLADAISIWDKGKDELRNLSLELSFKQEKDRAKIFLYSALKEGIFVKMGDITVRSENAIIPAIAQYKDITSLRLAIDNIIKNLSAKTKLEQIKEVA